MVECGPNIVGPSEEVVPNANLKEGEEMDFQGSTIEFFCGAAGVSSQLQKSGFKVMGIDGGYE